MNKMSKRKRFILKIFAVLLACIIGFITYAGIRTVPTLNSVTKIKDGFYMMDYRIDYDTDKLLEGVADTNEIYKYGAGQMLYADVDINLSGIGCTTFNAVNKAGESIMGRNFDYTDGSVMLVWTHPKNGYASVSTVDLDLLGPGTKPENFFSSLPVLYAPFACVDGMNEKGLCIAVLELETAPTYQDTAKPDLTTSTMIRVVLDKAATVKEAVKIFKSYDMHDDVQTKCTYHYQIADANGDSVVIEYVNGKINLIYPEDETNYQIVANYYLSKEAKDPKGFGHERADGVKKALEASDGVLSENKAMDVLKSVSVDKADWFGYECSTLWSVVYNTKDLTYDVCYKLDYEKVYSFSLSNPKEYKIEQNNK